MNYTSETAVKEATRHREKSLISTIRDELGDRLTGIIEYKGTKYRAKRSNPESDDSVRLLENEYECQRHAASEYVPEVGFFRQADDAYLWSPVNGDSLEQRLPEMSWEQIFRTLKETAKALKDVRAKKVYHNSLKPGNIILKDDSVQLTGFESALQVGIDYTVNGLSCLYGTTDNDWASPEQLFGEAGRDTDSWRLAATIYAVLASRVNGKSVTKISPNEKFTLSYDDSSIHWWTFDIDGISEVFKKLPDHLMQLKKLVSDGTIGNFHDIRPSMDEFITTLSFFEAYCHQHPVETR